MLSQGRLSVFGGGEAGGGNGSETYERADGAACGDGRDGAGADVASDAAAGGEEGEEEGLGGGFVLRGWGFGVSVCVFKEKFEV